MCIGTANTALPRRRLLQLLGAAGLSATALKYVRHAEAGSMSFLDRDEFIGGLERLLRNTRSTELEEFKFFHLHNTDMPWKDLGMGAKHGQAVTFLVGGRIWLSREHDLWVEPGVAFHVRSAGRKPMYNTMVNNGTMFAAHDGKIEIARSLAEWISEDGDLWTPPEPYQQADAEIYGVALKWKGDAEAGIRSLLAGGDVGGVLGEERSRLAGSQPLPAGWHNHFNAGGDDVIFRSGGPGQITCQSHKTGGLLRHPADMPLAPNTRLRWKWMVEELPSQLPEDQLAGHDYLSVGVEFDDGQDLTYFWSSNLPPGTTFRCPIPRWNEIETHMVIRTGYEGLGQWVNEDRDVFADYHTHVAGPAQNIVRVWLLAVTIFQRRHAACRYAGISLHSPAKELVIL